jgi:large repetitive protein
MRVTETRAVLRTTMRFVLALSAPMACAVASPLDEPPLGDDGGASRGGAGSDRADAGDPPAAASFSTLALALDGQTEFVRLGDLIFTSAAVSFWLNTTAGGFLVSKALLMANDPGELRVSVALGKLRCRQGGEVPDLRSDVAVADGRWHHVVITLNPGLNLYIDGHEQNARDPGNTTGLTLSGQQLELGRNNAQQNTYYAGRLDEVAIYERALSLGEVAEIYNGGVPNDLLELASATALRHWWRLGELDQPPIALDSVGSTNGELIDIDASNFAPR